LEIVADFLTVFGTTVTVTKGIETILQVETWTRGATWVQSFWYVQVVIPVFSFVRSRVVVPRPFVVTPSEASAALSSVVLISTVSGGAAVLAIMAGIVLFIVRSGKAFARGQDSSDESTHPLTQAFEVPTTATEKLPDTDNGTVLFEDPDTNVLTLGSIDDDLDNADQQLWL
jgi:hypothetical protein